jgi:hypothetical protein
LLRPRGKRPRRSGAAEQRDEVASFQSQRLPCFRPEDTTAGNLLHCGISIPPMTAKGQTRSLK